MRLPEMFGRDDGPSSLDPEMERDLNAVDATLAGLRVHPDLEELTDLTVALRAERPSLDEEFAALLDERAAAGFRRARASAARGLAARAGGRAASTPPRRLATWVGAGATAVVMVGVAVAVSGQFKSGTGQVSSSESAVPSSGAGAPGKSAPNAPAADAAVAQAKAQHLTQAARQLAPALSKNNFQVDNSGEPLPGNLSTSGRGFVPPSVTSRKVAQNADIQLSTDPDKVREVADGVTQVVSRYHGLVISSHVTTGQGSPKQPTPVPLPIGGSSLGADFQVRVPASQLQNALNDMSGLGLVVSRTEGSLDITRRFNAAHDQIANLVSERDTLIRQLAQATTPEAVKAIKHRLVVVRHELVRAQGRLGQLRERVRMVPVHVSIVSQGEGSGGGGGFGIDDALHDAGRVLTVTAGVLLISLAVIAPLAILALLAWLGARGLIRWRREQALEERGV